MLSVSKRTFIISYYKNNTNSGLKSKSLKAYSIKNV